MFRLSEKLLYSNVKIFRFSENHYISVSKYLEIPKI